MVDLFIIQNFGGHGSTHRESSTQKIKSDKSHVKTSRFVENQFSKETYSLYSGYEQNVSGEVSEFKCPWHQAMKIYRENKCILLNKRNHKERL